jgi:hypothetical protein
VKYASFSRRLAAYLLDALIGGVIFLVGISILNIHLATCSSMPVNGTW